LSILIDSSQDKEEMPKKRRKTRKRKMKRKMRRKSLYKPTTLIKLIQKKRKEKTIRQHLRSRVKTPHKIKV